FPFPASAATHISTLSLHDALPISSVAWTPSFDSGFLHRMTGNRKTVIRGGFGIVYDRINTVQSVIIPMLGVGFAQTISVGAPLRSEEHTSELQSLRHLVCRLLLEK